MIGLIYWCPITHERKEVALRSVHAEARCVDLCASVQLTQRYVNNTPRPVEAVYVFPLDSRAAVSGFEVEIDGVVTKADVQEKAEARQTYERAKAAGDSAQLLEKVTDDVFQMSVGNLKPWSSAEIRITYVADVEIEGDGVLFFLPTFVAPRYTPASAKAVPSTGANAAPDGLRLDLVAAMSSDIVSMESQTEGLEIATTEHPGNGRVRTATLRNAVMSLNKDLVVKIVTKEPHTPRCLVEHNPATGTYAGVVTLAPQIEFDDEPSELVFVVDRSGSMSGYNIEKAKKALELFFRSLPEDCYINIVGFGSSFQTLWPRSVKYSAASLEEASRHIARLKADLGGTEIATPLRQVLSQPPIKGYARQVFVLTDGQVSNTNETITIVQDAVRAEPSTRVFALGLGNGASHELVEGLAKAGHGTASFCVGDANLQEKVVAQLSRAIQPALTDVKIEWEGAKGAPPRYDSDAVVPPAQADGGLLGAFAPSSAGSLLKFSARTKPAANPADTEGFARAPYHPPPVHTGARFLSYCLVKAGGTPPSAVRITAKSPVGPLDVRLEVAPTDVVQGTLLHTMAARSLISDLEKGTSWMHGSTPRRVDPAAVKAEIVRLGTEYSLASKHTSFVAVQHRAPGSDPVMHTTDLNSYVMHGEIDRVLMRGECLDTLCQQSESLSSTKMFYKGSKSSNSGGGFFSSLFGGSASPRSRSKRCAAPSAPAACPPSAPVRRRSPSEEMSAPMMFSSLFSNSSPMPQGGMPPPAPPMACQGPPPPPMACMSRSSSLCDAMASDDDNATDLFCAPMSNVDACNFDLEFSFAPAADCAKESAAQPKPADKASLAKPSGRSTLSPNELLDEIIKLQDFSGSFALSNELVALLGCDLAAAQAAAARFIKVDGERLVATALAIRFIRTKLAELQAQWKLVEAKAVKYVKKASIAGSIDSADVFAQTAQMVLV